MEEERRKKAGLLKGVVFKAGPEISLEQVGSPMKRTPCRGLDGMPDMA